LRGADFFIFFVVQALEIWKYQENAEAKVDSGTRGKSGM